MKMRVADYIALHLQKIGVRYVFMLSGGGMMHLIDAIGRVDGMKYLCNFHEQASAMAADGYARLTNSLGVCYATSGPGATNILTGLVGAWQDSSPVLFITGQSNVSQTIQGSKIEGLRQFGTFEVDIVSIVRPVTKYAVFLDDPKMVRYHLEKAIHLALGGRSGPVLIDVPLNVQAATIDPETLEGYQEEISSVNVESFTDDVGLKILTKIQSSKRPLILAGYGIRCAGAVSQFQAIINQLQIPVVTTQLAKDVLPYDDKLFVGHPGVKGDRPGNFAVQNADFILSVGCSLHTQTTGYELDQFAVNAYKIQVDLDQAILKKENVGVTQKICCDINTFLGKLSILIDKGWDESKFFEWRQRCGQWKDQFPVNLEEHKLGDGPINYYEFVDTLSELLQGNEAIITDAGSAFYVMGQAFKIKGSQRYIVSGSMGAMGYALPASLGVSCANPAITAICVMGDGSLQTNIQELQTLKHYGLNVKVFVVNNEGYASIRNTQKSFFSGYYVGSSYNSGVSLPPLDKIANAYGLPYFVCEKRENLRVILNKVLQTSGPVICGVTSQPDQEIIPTVSSVRLPDGSLKSKPIHDMYPFMNEDELQQNMCSD